ncbi:hypothetical protein ANN_16909 [Periplaneta americana]|uniref:Uncharacterized protein n=1 Tax=Periplaneta americana TaxID=6978 RepID=A0ABQ8SSX8_PERAM|nr:hypothetical protein ANN_16909 [Periplaneta americana]
MAGLCEGGNEPPGSLKASKGYISVAGMPEFCPAGVLFHDSKCSNMSLWHLSTLKCHRPAPGSNPQPRAKEASTIPTAPSRRTFVPLAHAQWTELPHSLLYRDTRCDRLDGR